MEEVDGIIIATLRDIGCDFSDEVADLTDFTSDNLVEACVYCLRLIIPDFDSPTTLPEAMSAKFRICTGLANACQGLGYQAEIGYQTFLYSSVKDWRKLLMFLLEKLPKGNTQGANEPTGAGLLLTRSIADELRQCIQSPWIPYYCKRRSTRWVGPSSWRIEGCQGLHRFCSSDIQAPQGNGDLKKKIPKEVKSYYTKHMPYIVAQPAVKESLISAILAKNANEVAMQQEWEAEWNQSGLASRLTEEEYRSKKRQKLQKKLAEQLRAHNKAGQGTGTLGTGSDLQSVLNSFLDQSSSGPRGSRFQHTEKLQFAKEDEGPVAMEVTSEEDLKKQREDELTSLQEQFNSLTEQLEALDLNMRKYTVGIQQMQEQKAQQESKNKEEEESYRIKKGTYDLLPNADENIAKLQEMIATSSDRMVKLASKWEEVREPLVRGLRDLKSKKELTEAEEEMLLEEIKLLRERMKEVADETRGKEDLYKQLVNEYGRMTKDTNRSAYTKRIMEIVVNIKKQKDEINKILADTRSVQKEINQLSGKLERVFQITDEQVFKDAKKDEARRSAYKLLASIRENSSKVVESIKETGQIKREQRDLEEQIDRESSKKVAANLEKIMVDYQQIKKENIQLVAQLKS